MYQITDVTCEQVKNPINLTVTKPRFGWRLASDQNNVRQKAYQIVVTDENGEVVWDSGRVESRKTFEVEYQGQPLQSLRGYRGKIVSWGAAGETEVAEAAGETGTTEEAAAAVEMTAEAEFFFETAFMDYREWKARWIEPSEPLPQLAENPLPKMEKKWMDYITAMMRGEEAEFISDEANAHGEELEPYDPALLLRRTFAISGSVKKAKIFATAHGIYQISINGTKISDALLTPGFTTYDKRIKYQAYDVTGFLRQGENALSATVTDGWYKGKIALGRGCEYGEIPGFLMQMELWYEDGQRETIVSDGEFTWSFDGEIRTADLFLGQNNDGRKKCEPSKVDFDDSGWKKAAVKEAPDTTLYGQVEPLVKVFARVPAKRVFTAPNGDTVVDFGQNLAGHLWVEVREKEGEQITFEHGEVLDKEGNFTYTFTGSTQGQQDEYICGGGETEIFEPEFTYHGFRYVRVRGGSNWRAEQFAAMAVTTENPVTGSFSCSDEKINQLQHNIYWSQVSNNITIPTDCPTREKAGWTGDVVVYGPTALYNQDMRAFYEDWLRSIRAEQREDGHIMHTVPRIKNYVQQAMAGSIGWGDVILTLPWQLYHLWGDERVLEENYSAMKRWIDAMIVSASQLQPQWQELEQKADLTPEQARHLDNQKYLVNTGFHFGDWLVPSVKNEQGFSDGQKSSFLTMQYVDSAILAGMAELLAEISRLLNQKQEKKEYEENAAYYQHYADRAREAFYEEFCDENGRLGQDMQGNYTLALKYHMLPKEMEEKAAANLNQMLVDNDYIMDAGFMSVGFFLDMLMDHGYEETAWKVLWQKKCPSWLYEVEHGATTMWENWDAMREDGTVDWCSFNHYAFGCVGDFLYRRVLGLNNAGIGYDRIRIAPAYRCGLSWAEGSFDSVSGSISVRWEKVEKGYQVQVDIPANTTAEVVLWDGSVRKVGSGSYTF